MALSVMTAMSSSSVVRPKSTWFLPFERVRRCRALLALALKIGLVKQLAHFAGDVVNTTV